MTEQRVVPRTTPIRVNGIRKRNTLRLSGSWNTVALIFAVVVLVGLPLYSLLGIYPHSPFRPDPTAIGVAPNSVYWFGTDGNGMDVFSRTIEAAKLDVPISLAATILAVLVGVPIGLFATSGKVGDAVMRVVDAFAAIPIIVLAIVAIQLMGGGVWNVVLAIAIVAAPRFVRLARASAITIRSSRYVEAAISIGCSPMRVAFNHVFRNAYGVVLVQATLTAANALGTIAALNFLGVGLRPPTPSWGGMISDGSSMLIRGEWWAATFPTIAILLIIFSLNIVAGAIENRIERLESAR